MQQEDLPPTLTRTDEIIKQSVLEVAGLENPKNVLLFLFIFKLGFSLKMIYFKVCPLHKVLRDDMTY